MATLLHYLKVAFHSTSGLNQRQWMLLLVGVAVWGVFCMRGFGSRKHS